MVNIYMVKINLKLYFFNQSRRLAISKEINNEKSKKREKIRFRFSPLCRSICIVHSPKKRGKCKVRVGGGALNIIFDLFIVFP